MNFAIAIFIIISLSILLGYFFGSLMWSIIISKIFYKIDIRDYASKNPGTTNTLRVLGKKAGIAVLFLDVFKVLIPTIIVWLIYFFILKDYLISKSTFNYGNLIYLTPFFAIIGHIFPIFFNFKGGKGVACALGFYLSVSFFIGILFILIILIIVLISKYVSLGSTIASSLCSFFILVPGINYFYLIDVNLLSVIDNLYSHTLNAIFIFLLGLIIAILILIKHRSNFINIKNKTENKLFIK